jgi:hypothetical protein
MSVFAAMPAAFSTIFSLEKSRKWIIREGLTGISRSGSGAPIACDWKKSLGFLTLLLASFSALSAGNLAERPFVAKRRSSALVAVIGGMEASASDGTEDWLLPEQSRPPLLGELEQRIDLALATARASEAAVTKVGAAALDAAKQARRAAELAERASAAALDARKKAAPAAVVSPAASARPESADDSLSSFSERADRLVARLRGLQRIPLAAPAASGGAGQPQPAR